MFPEHAPFDAAQRTALESLIADMDSNQKAWLSGYLAASGGDVLSASAATGAELTVLYGTESGNAESLADRAVKEARKRGMRARMRNMADISAADLTKTRDLLVIVSTWGDGEPPETAAAFHKQLMTGEIPLSGVKFSVCGLGDTSYEKFCQTGKEIDERLAALGGERIAPRQDCDVDFEESFAAWLEKSLSALTPGASAVVAAVPTAEPAVEYGKKHPFPAELLDVVILNGKGSAKETLHLEFSLAGSGMNYEPGDALAVLPLNAPDVVEEILKAAKLGGDETVTVKDDGDKPLAEALRGDFDITALSRNVLTKLVAATDSAKLRELLGEDAKDRLREYIDGRQVIDAIQDFAPEGLPAATLAGLFRKLPPRLYSIASSPLAHPDEVHLTVSAVRYLSHGRARKGVCSTYMADLLKAGDRVPVFVQPNKNFRLPADGGAPIIMVGPGTGIAPFRAFVEHRAATGAGGKNWLFTGDQHYLHDFLYQLEWQDHLKSGALTRLDVAFSRDQPEKIYVQHRLAEHGAEVFAWLEAGAHFYVCGDAARMAGDVHEALVSIAAKHGGKSREAAEEYIENLKSAKRYHRDVY
ncbi:MAG: assimilatory sulfite reductase (NADPH) flavoprotein subunit [Luteolibacter sp.]